MEELAAKAPGMVNQPLPIDQTSDEEATTAEPVPLKKRFLSLRTLLSFGFALAIFVFFLTRMDLDVGATLRNLGRANLFLFASALVVFYLSFVVRSLRWQQFLRNADVCKEAGPRMPSLWGLLEILFLSWFTNCIVPAKLGDAYRGYLLKRNAKVSFATTMGTVLAERITDLIVLFFLLIVAALLAYHGKLPEQLTPVFIFGLALVGVIVLLLVAMRYFGQHVPRFLPHRVRPIYTRLEAGTLRSFKALPVVLTYTAMVWGLEGARLLLVTKSLDVHIGFSIIVFIALTSSLLTTLPLTPAGLGIVESAMVTALLWSGMTDQNLAGSIAILDRSISYWSIVVFGIIVYILSKKKWR